MPGGFIVGDSGLCCCGPVQCVTSIVRAQLLPICLLAPDRLCGRGKHEMNSVMGRENYKIETQKKNCIPGGTEVAI